MKNDINSTVVTAGDGGFAWGALLLVASMRMNGMPHPAVVGAMNWPDAMKKRICALENVTIHELPYSRRCVACLKPVLMGCDEVKTDWVCWADADGIFVGDCGEWLAGDSPDEITIRKYGSVPPDFTPENLKIWQQDVERFQGRALESSRYDTRVNTAFIVIHRRHLQFLRRWQNQIENVLPPDVGIIMKHGSAYFQTDESVLSSLLCFSPDAPKIAGNYRSNRSADKDRYFAHFAYNPKPWRMWNTHSAKWRDQLMQIVDWMLAEKIVSPSDLPRSLRRNWWPVYRACSWSAPWVWRAMKLQRRIFGK